MDFMKALFDQEKHPVVELLLMRNHKSLFSNLGPDAPEQILLNSMPHFDRVQILNIEGNIKAGKPLNEAFKHYIGMLQFDERKMNQCFTLLEQYDKPTIHTSVSSLLSILTYCVHPELPCTSADMQLIIRSLCILDSDYKDICGYFFSIIMNKFLADKNFFWSEESIIIVCQYIDLCEKVSSEHFSIIQDFISMSQEKYFKKASNHLLHLIDVYIKRRDKAPKIKDFCKILHFLDPYIKLFDPVALEVISYASKFQNLQVTKDCFITIPIDLADKIQKPSIHIEFEPVEEDRYQVNRRLSVSETIEDEFFSFDPISKEETQPTMTVESILDEKTLHLMNTIINSIEEADGSCIDCFLSSFAKVINVDNYKEKDSFFKVYICFLLSVSRFSRITSILTFADNICHPNVFDERYTIFGKISPELNAIRSHIFSLLLTAIPSVLPDILYKIKNPKLVAECIARCMYANPQPNPRIFSSQRSLAAITMALSKLDIQKGNLAALSTLLSFINILLREENVAMECFGDPAFTEAYLDISKIPPAVQPITVAVHDYLAIASAESIDALTASVGSLLRECSLYPEAENPKVIAQKLAFAVADAAAHNPSIISKVDSVLDQILECAVVMRCRDLQNSALRFLSSLSFGKSIHFDTNRLLSVIEMIHTNEGATPDLTTLNALVNICSGTNTIQHDSLFLVRSPDILPVILLVYRESSEIASILRIFHRLCAYSQENCAMMHEGCIDLMLLDVLSSRESAEITFRGRSYRVAVPWDLVDTHIYPIVFAIQAKRSCNAEARRFVKLVLSGDEVIAEKAAMQLTAYISSTLTAMRPVFNLGTKAPLITIKSLDFERVNRTFSIAFWLRVDHPVSMGLDAHFPIITVSSQREGFELLLSHSAIFYRVWDETNSTLIQCESGMDSNTWVSCVFVMQRTRDKKTGISFYFNGDISTCTEGPLVNFTSEIEATVGGGGANGYQIPGNLGAFGMSYSLLSGDSIIDINQRGPMVINNNNFVVKVPADISNDNNIICSEMEPDRSLMTMLASGGHMAFLTQIFSHETKLSKVVIGIIKLILGESMRAQESFGSFCFLASRLETMNGSFLTYQLYLAFYSIGDTITLSELSADFFDCIIMNERIWSKSPDFTRITNHWNVTASGQYRPILLRPGYFGKLLGAFETLIDTIHDQNDKTRRTNLFAILMQCEGLTKKDIELMISSTFITRPEDEESNEIIVNHLDLVRHFAGEILASGTVILRLGCFHIFMGRSKRVVIAALKAMHSLTDTFVPEFIATIHSISFRDDFAEIILEIAENISKFPGLISFIAAAGVYLPQDAQHFIAATLKACITSDIPLDRVLSDPLWSAWPITLLLTVSDLAKVSVVYYIARCIERTKEPEAEIYRTVNILQGVFAAYNQPLGIISTTLIEEVSSFLSKDTLNELCVRLLIMKFGPSNSMVDGFDFGVFGVTTEILKPSAPKSLIDLVSLDSSQLNEYLMSICFETYGGRNGAAKLAKEFTNSGTVFHNLASEIYEPSNDRTKLIIMGELLPQASIELSWKYNQGILSIFNQLQNAARAAWNKESIEFDRLYNSAIMHIASRISIDVDILRSTVSLAASSAAIFTDSFTASRSPFFASPYCPSLYSMEPTDSESMINDHFIFTLPDFQSPLFSAPARLYELGKSQSICFSIGQKDFQILKTQQTYRNIGLERIQFIIPREMDGKQTSLEIFTDTESFFIDLAPIESDKALDTFYSLIPGLSGHPDKKITRIIQSRGVWSNFDLCMFLSNFAGRSVHISGREPLLLNGVSYTQFILSDSTDPGDVLERRRKLEEMDRHDLIEKLYPEFVAHASLATTVVEKSSDAVNLNVEGSLSVLLFDGGQIQVFERLVRFVYFDERAAEVKIPSIEGSFEMVSSGDSVLISLSDEKKIMFVNPDGFQVVSLSATPSWIAACGDCAVVCCNECEIRSAKLSSWPLRFAPIALFTEKVACVGVNHCGVVAVGTARGRIHVVSAEGNAAFFAIQNLGIAPRAVWVSDAVTAVAVDLQSHIGVYSPSGAEICRFRSLRSGPTASFMAGGEDFVAFQNCDRQVMAVSLFTGRKQIVSQVVPHVSAISFESRTNRIVFISGNRIYFSIL